MKFLLYLAISTSADISLLAHDEFAIREQASQSLRAKQDLAAPALLLASYSKDAERKKRANRIVAPILRSWDDAAFKTWAFWVFYSPNAVTVHLWQNAEFGRRLPPESSVFKALKNAETFYRLREIAFKWRLARNEDDDYHVEVWIGRIRARAYGLDESRIQSYFDCSGG